MCEASNNLVDIFLSLTTRFCILMGYELKIKKKNLDGWIGRQFGGQLVAAPPHYFCMLKTAGSATAASEVVEDTIPLPAHLPVLGKSVSFPSEN